MRTESLGFRTKRNHNNIKVIHAHGFLQKGREFHKEFIGHEFDWPGFMSFVRKFNYAGAVTMEIFPFGRLFHFKLPPQVILDKAKETIEDNFRILKRV